MSKFTTPRVVTTIAQSRIDYNQSTVSLLENFSGSSAPIATDISLEGVTGLKTGMFWYKSGGNSSLGQNRFLVYNGSSFTRNGIGTFQMSSIAAANAAAVAGNIEYGDLVLVNTNDLFLVNTTGTGIVRIGEAATTLSGLTSDQFIRSDIDATASGNVRFTSNNFITIPIGNTAQRPVGTSAQPGQIRFNTQLNIYESYFGTAWRNLSGITEVVANSSNFSGNVVFASANGAVLYSNSSLTFNPSTGTLSSTTFNSTSDIRVKENIRQIPDALDKLEILSGYIFNFIGQSQESAGLLAQELQQALPQCVTEQNGIFQVNYAGALALLLQGFKEYREITDDRLNKLESRLDGR
jgi:hypothetical protein